MSEEPRNIIELSIDGAQVVLDVEADTSIYDLDEDLQSVASLISWYGRILAAARRRLAALEEAATLQRARLVTGLLAADPKLSEWKARFQVDADAGYHNMKMQAIEAKELVDRLWHATVALENKASVLCAMAGKARSEMHMTGASVRDRDDLVREKMGH